MEDDTLKIYIEAIERLTAQKRDLTQEIKDLFEEAHGKGFDKKALRQVLKVRASDRKQLEYIENLRDTYLDKLGDI